MRPLGTRSGLTLIEVLVVIFVIAILTGLLLPGSHQGAAARKAMARNDLTQLVTATKAFYTDYGFYPIDPSISGRRMRFTAIPVGATTIQKW